MGNENAVLIIGAGAAGLSAARELTAAGAQVIVIEARDRVGGRIHTLREDFSAIPIELGAEFVHGKHPQLLEIIEASRILFCDVTERHWYIEKGLLSNSHDFWNKLTALMDLMNLEEPDRSFQDFLDSIPDDEAIVRAKAVATRYVQGFHAADVNRIGVHGLVKANEAEDEIQGDKSFRILRGYDLVTSSLLEPAKTNGAIVHCNAIVKELHWRKHQIEAVCLSRGQTQHFHASRAVVTLPLGVLQARPDQGGVRFVPKLPENKQQAISSLAMGHATRITLLFRERFWEGLDIPAAQAGQDLTDVGLTELGFIHYPDADIPTWWTLLPVRAPVMIGWAGGPKSTKLSGRDAKYIEARAVNSLKQIFGVSEKKLRQLLLASHTHDWNSDPFARGAYAYLPVDGLLNQQILAEPLEDTLFFAGEATSVGHVGTVHGAIESGHRVAKEILANR